MTALKVLFNFKFLNMDFGHVFLHRDFFKLQFEKRRYGDKFKDYPQFYELAHQQHAETIANLFFLTLK